MVKFGKKVKFYYESSRNLLKMPEFYFGNGLANKLIFTFKT